MEILRNLRAGEFDVLVGEFTSRRSRSARSSGLVLDADRKGF